MSMQTKICKTCGAPLEIRQTRRTPEQIKKQYYYTAYYYCPHCHKMYHDDKFKVTNESGNMLFTNMRPEDTLQIWTDGACSYNGTPRARAAWAFVSGSHEEAERVIGKQTNNTAEAYAIYHGLVWAAKEKKKEVTIYSDSQISLNNLKKPLAQIKENREIFAKIYEVIEGNDLQVQYQKVLGHSGDPNNERADKLANGLVGIR